MNRVFLIVVLMLCGWATAGCAIHYFDPTTGTEHLWGFGHMKMKVAAPNEGLQALVRETQTFGLTVGSLDAQKIVVESTDQEMVLGGIQCKQSD